MRKSKRMRPGFEEALEQLERIVSEDFHERLKEAVALQGASPCILCGRLTSDGGIYLPYGGGVRAVLYGLCNRCIGFPGLVAEIVSRIHRRWMIGPGGGERRPDPKSQG